MELNIVFCQSVLEKNHAQYFPLTFFFFLPWFCVQSCLEEMPRHMKTFQMFQNMDEYGEMVVPADKLEEIKRRSVNQNLNSSLR